MDYFDLSNNGGEINIIVSPKKEPPKEPDSPQIRNLRRIVESYQNEDQEMLARAAELEKEIKIKQKELQILQDQYMSVRDSMNRIEKNIREASKSLQKEVRFHVIS